MDDQHGILMDAINEVRLALLRGSGRENISEQLDQLIEFMRMHFRCEEQLMEKAGFPGLEDHRAEHHKMLAEILQAAHRLQYGEALHLRPLLCRLHDGFLEHIENLDQQYGPLMNQHGVQ
jgi:hemerythrin